MASLALSTALVQQLHQGMSDAAQEPGVPTVVLSHTGRTFCAGADLSEAEGHEPGEVAVDRTRQLTDVLRAIPQSPVPVIAALHGDVRAGGLGLIGACDIVVAGTSSTFMLTEALHAFDRHAELILAVGPTVLLRRGA